MKGVIGVVPFAGPLLVEIAGTTIPNQRVDRIAKLVHSLAKRIRILELEQAHVRAQITDEEFTDLVEEGLRQAARSLSDERRDYLASIIARSLSSDDISYQESKHLMRLLGEINDVEVIWLVSYFHTDMRRQDAKSFHETHKDLLSPQRAFWGTSQAQLDKLTLQESYKQHLAQLYLLVGIPEYNPIDDKPRIRRYEITELGKLLLREIGI